MRRAAIFGVLVMVVHGGLLAASVGYVGASRAMSVGPATLADDHLGGVLIAAAGAFVVALLASVRRPSPAVANGGLAVLLGLDLAAALGAVLAVGELGVADLPRAFVVVSGLGSGVVAAALGAGVGVALGRRRGPG